MDAKTLLQKTASAARARDMRARLYAGALTGVFGFHLIRFSTSFSSLLLAIGAFLCVLLGVSASAVGRRIPNRAINPAILAAVLLSAAAPLIPRVLSGPYSAPQAIAQGTYWSCVAICLFGGRLLAERREIEMSELWGHPRSLDLGTGSASLLSAFALGLGALFVFYVAISGVTTSDPVSAVVLTSVKGPTVVHISIMLLFFVICAHEIEAAAQVAGNASLLRKIAGSLDADMGGGSAAALRAILRDLEPTQGHREPVRYLLAAMDDPEEASSPTLTAFLHLKLSSRRYVRALIAALPMLGFVGTIIGLTNTLSDLPSAIGAGTAQTAIDLTGALGGLALKFQTSLLGLMASILCGLGLALLEKKESDLRSLCALLAARVS